MAKKAEDPHVKRLYLDSCTIVYLVEAAGPFHVEAVARLMDQGRTPGAVLVTSSLSRLECRTKPLRENDLRLLARYDAFFSATGLEVAPISDDVNERATQVRATFGLRKPDAIHVATALLENADALLTGDAALGRCDEVNVEVLRPGGGSPAGSPSEP